MVEIIRERERERERESLPSFERDMRKKFLLSGFESGKRNGWSY